MKTVLIAGHGRNVSDGLIKALHAAIVIGDERKARGNCATCGTKIDPEEFKDQLSKDEFVLSGMCQKCQDSFFNEDAEKEEGPPDEGFGDEVGGFHDCGTGWNPNGVWCGECSKCNCKGCAHQFDTKGPIDKGVD